MSQEGGSVIKLLVVDDHCLVREGLMTGLRALGADTLIFGAADAIEANRVLETDSIDLVLLDLLLPNVKGLSYLRIVKRRFPRVRVVILSALCDPEMVAQAMKAGASGFISKASSVTELLAALRLVLRGEISVPSNMIAEVARSESSRKDGGILEKRFGVTPAQARVLDLLAQGRGNRAIAELLGVTEGTVKIHVSAILKSMGLRNRAEVALAVNKKQRQQ
jgi:DNA-binding NarL/FixJ family response regulator